MTHTARPDLAATAILGLAAVLSLDPGDAHAGKRVTVCHVPPGNEANRHTIQVGEASVGAHLAHGDEIGACSTGCMADPSICDDGNACTSDACTGTGQCSHEAVGCDDDNACTVDACDPTLGCTAVADDGASCDDGNACTSGDGCHGTVCQGAPIEGCCSADADCDDDAACTFDLCADGLCENEPIDCSVSDVCSAGFCDVDGECSTTPISCDDGDPCTADACDAVVGCVHEPAVGPECSVCGDGVVQPGEQCDDGNTHPFDGCDGCILVDTTPD